MSKVAFFSNQFANANAHGISRYAKELFQSLSTNQQGLEITPVSAWSNLSDNELSLLIRQTNLKILPTGRRLTPLVWTLINNPKIEQLLQLDTDIVHAVSMGYPIATRKSLVVTVHDIGPLILPEYFKNTSPWIMKRSLKQTVKQADVIICVSQSTANDLVDYAGAHVSNRIKVIHEGVSTDFFEQSSNSLEQINLSGLPPPGVPFIMAAGKISPRKNIHALIQAYRGLIKVIPHHLVLVGGNGWDIDEVQTVLKSEDLQDRVHLLGYVTDEQLKILYANASMYIHPSLYEGFGLTVLEAMAAGCPVITSNTYSLPEIAEGAALLVDPNDTAEIATAIRCLALSPDVTAELSEKGLRRAKSFTWGKCADQVLKVYQELL